MGQFVFDQFDFLCVVDLVSFGVQPKVYRYYGQYVYLLESSRKGTPVASLQVTQRTFSSFQVAKWIRVEYGLETAPQRTFVCVAEFARVARCRDEFIRMGLDFRPNFDRNKPH